MRLINTGSVQDIWSTLKCCEDKYTVQQLEEEIKEEADGRNRKTVINMLMAAIRRKQKKSNN